MKKNTFIILFISFAFLMSAQHPYFASLNQQLLVTNPSFAGSNKQLRVQSNLGGYWYTNSIWYYLGADILIKKHSGFGISYHGNNYKNGLLFQNQISLTYAYHFIIKQKLKIVPSIQASYFNLRLDMTKLNFGELIGEQKWIYDPRCDWGSCEGPSPNQFKQNADFSAGLLVYKENFFIGASILSVTQPDQGLLGVSKRPLTQIYQGGYNFKLKQKWTCNAYTFIKVQQIYLSFLQLGTNVGYDKFKLHLGFRFNEAAIQNIGIIGINYSFKGFTMGYNFTGSYYNDNLYSNSHQLFVSMNFGNCKKKDEAAASTTPAPIKLFF